MKNTILAFALLFIATSAHADKAAHMRRYKAPKLVQNDSLLPELAEGNFGQDDADRAQVRADRLRDSAAHWKGAYKNGTREAEDMKLDLELSEVDRQILELKGDVIGSLEVKKEMLHRRHELRRSNRRIDGAWANAVVIERSAISAEETAQRRQADVIARKKSYRQLKGALERIEASGKEAYSNSWTSYDDYLEERLQQLDAEIADRGDTKRGVVTFPPYLEPGGIGRNKMFIGPKYKVRPQLKRHNSGPGFVEYPQK